MRVRGRGGGRWACTAGGHTGTVDGFLLGGRKRRAVDERVRLRHELLLGRGVCRLRGPVRLQVRYLGYLGRHRQRYHWLAARLVGPRPSHPRDDPSPAGLRPCRSSSASATIRRALRIAAAAIIFVFLIPYTASVYNGLSRLFGMAFDAALRRVRDRHGGGHLRVRACVGGYMATVMNDFIQGIVMLLGITAVIVAVILSNGGFSEAIVAAVADPGAEGSAMARSVRQLLRARLCSTCWAWWCCTSLGTWGLPQMVQKFYAIKSGPGGEAGRHHLHHLRVRGGRWLVLPGRVRSPLRAARSSTPPTARPSTTRSFPTMLSTLARRADRPGDSAGAVGVHVDALARCVLTSSSTLTIDFIKGNIVKKMAEKQQILSGCACLLVVFIAISARNRAGAVPLFGGVHRAADGLLVGRAGRCVPRAVPVGPVFREQVSKARCVVLVRCSAWA